MDGSTEDLPESGEGGWGSEFLRGRQLVALVVVAVVVLVAGLVALSAGGDDGSAVIVPPVPDVDVSTSLAGGPPLTTSPLPLPSTVASTSSTTTSTSSTTTPSTTVAFAPAVAEAGDDLEVDIGTDVRLAAVDLSEPDQSVVWRQRSGPDVTGGTGRLLGAEVRFVAPLRPATLTFEMTVTGRSGDTAVDTVRIDVFADVSAAVFVDADAGADIGDGTRGRPYRTIAAALAAAPEGADLYLRSSLRPHTLDRIVLRGGNDIYGGYDADWVRDPANPARIETVDGLRIDGPGATTISGVSVVGPESVESSVAVSAEGLDRLVIEDSRVEGGRSAEGASIGVSAQGVDRVVIVRSTVTAGRGGDGVPGVPGGAAGAPAPDGGPAIGTTGGVGGGNGEQGEDGGVPGGSGASGANGADGVPGAEGEPGSGLAEPDRPDATGASGGVGLAGGAGGGGIGGSAGVAVGSLAGGGGGGGGGGGAGGGGGLGGGGGRGSIGLSLVDVGRLVVIDSSVIGGEAGTGGAGGVGGPGAAGGVGGAGGAGQADGSSTAGSGGAGGRGGVGGAGGAGGGGAGGTSVGILTARVDQVVLRDSTVLGGAGGLPGNSPLAVATGGDSIGWWAPAGAAPTGPVLVERTEIAAGAPGPGGRAIDRLGVA